MITFTSAQIAAWIATFFFPFARIFAFLNAAPVFGSPQVNLMARAGLALALSLIVAPLLPPPPPFDFFSPLGVMLLVQQVLLGIAMGMVMRVVFSVTEFTGQFIGLQAGLGFAMLFDPQNGAQSPVIGQFLGLLTTLVFLSLNGHLIMIEALVESFSLFPLYPAQPMNFRAWYMVAEWGGEIFRLGTLLALPVVVAMLITNISLGVVSKLAPQLNVFVIGFPIMLAMGFYGLSLLLPTMIPALERLLHRGITVMLELSRNLAF